MADSPGIFAITVIIRICNAGTKSQGNDNGIPRLVSTTILTTTVAKCFKGLKVELSNVTGLKW